MRSNLPGQQAAPTPLLYTPPAAPQSHPVEQTSQQRPAPAPQLLYTPPPAARPQAPRRTVQAPQPRLMASRQQGGPPVFSRVSARMVQSAGDLALLRWVNGSSSPASIQYVQGEGATVVSVEANGRTLFSSTPGEARVRFDAGMPAVPPQGEVRVMVRRVSLSSAPGAELGLFSSAAYTAGADSSEAPSLPVPTPTSEPKPNWTHIAVAAAAGASVASFLTYAVMQRSVRTLKDQRDRARANHWRSMTSMVGQHMEDSAKDGTLFRDRSGPRSSSATAR